MGPGKAIATIVAELTGLFVEDRNFALAIAAWICAFAILMRFAAVTGPIAGIAFFAGFAAILVASTLRAATRHKD